LVIGQSKRPITKKHYLKLLIRRLTIRLLLLPFFGMQLELGKRMSQKNPPKKREGKTKKTMQVKIDIPMPLPKNLAFMKIVGSVATSLQILYHSR
jgi:hypothetical protein